jgi:hypothetical protein
MRAASQIRRMRVAADETGLFGFETERAIVGA